LSGTTLSRADISYPTDAHAAFAQIEDSSYWFQHRNRVIEATIRSHAPDGAIIDVGGGTGVVAAHLRKAGFQNVVVEPDAAGAARARARGLDVVEGALSQLGAPAASVAATSLFDVVEHIEDDLGVLRETHALTKPGGRLYLTVPAYAWLWSNEDVLAGHFRRYTSASLRDVVTRAGYEVSFCSYFFGFLVTPIALLRALPSAAGIKVGQSCDSSAESHTPPPEPINGLMKRSFAHEIAHIQRGRELAFGSSLILAATRI
jgi:SAM-dependent methyltransferase